MSHVLRYGDATDVRTRGRRRSPYNVSGIARRLAQA